MCSLFGKFVVPKRPAALTGWWVGQLLDDEEPEEADLSGIFGKRVCLKMVSLLRVDNPNYRGSLTIWVDKEDLRQFDTVNEAFMHLGSLRSDLFAPA